MGIFDDTSDEQNRTTLKWFDENVIRHPEYGREFKRLVAKASPNTKQYFPEIEMEEVLDAKTKESQEKIDKFLESQKEKENKAYWEGERRKVVEKQLLTQEQLPDFEKWMMDHHMGDYQLAADSYQRHVLKPAEPTNYQERTGIQIPSAKGLFENPTQWAREEAYKEINELQRKRGAS